MGLPVVKESCCGCSLETGAKIIGYVHLILSCVLLLMLGVVLATILNEDPETVTDKPLPPTQAPPDNLYISRELSLALSIFLALAPAAVGVLSLFLLIGAKKKNSYLLLPWLIGVGLLILIYLVLLLFFIFIVLSGGRLNNHFVSLLIKICIFTYCYIVVYSFYIELRQGRQDPA